MSDQGPATSHGSDASDGDAQVEVSIADTRSAAALANAHQRASGPDNASTSPFAPRLTRRARALRVGGIAGAVLLALVVVLGGFPAARSSATRLLAGLHPTPTATLVPGSNAFYLLPNPPGTTVLLDGHALTVLPLPGDPHPLVLARGAHTFAWRNTVFPFLPLSCHVTVPRVSHASRDDCALIQPYQVSGNPNDMPLAAPIIVDRLSLAALSPDLASALTTAIRAALAGMSATAAIALGEHYLDSNSTVKVATQPLTAVFQVRTIPDNLSIPCLDGAPWLACRYQGQECDTLCTLASSAAPGAGSVWIAGIAVQVVWNYVASGGTVVQRNVQAPGFGIETALFGVTWDGTIWRARPLLGQHDAIPTSDDLVCDAAWQSFYQSPISYFFYPDASHSLTFHYASGARVSDGCVVRLANNPQTTAPLIPGDGSALVLERCGVLLAANDTAHTLLPGLPRANPAERQDALRLATALPAQWQAPA